MAEGTDGGGPSRAMAAALIVAIVGVAGTGNMLAGVAAAGVAPGVEAYVVRGVWAMSEAASGNSKSH